MNTKTVALKLIASIMLLISANACTNAQSAPTMLDYSYVPPAKSASSAYNFELDN